MNLDTSYGQHRAFLRLLQIKKERGIKGKRSTTNFYWASHTSSMLKKAWAVNKHRSRAEWKQLVEDAVQEALALQGGQMATKVTATVIRAETKVFSDFNNGDILVDPITSDVGVKVASNYLKWLVGNRQSIYTAANVPFIAPKSVDITVTL